VKDSEKPSESRFPLTKNSPSSEAQNATPTQTVRMQPRTSARARTAWTYTKLAFGTLFCLAFMAAGAIFGNFYYRSNAFRQIVRELGVHPLVVIRSLGDPLAPFQPNLQFTPDKQHSITVLFLGCDVDYENTRPLPIKSSNGRSDAIFIARINFDNQTIQGMSIPRDTAVRIPGHGFHKINAAHSFGGSELSQETIKEAFGISTDYYVAANFYGFQKIVDALGGVDLSVEKKLDYDDNWGNLHVHLKPGYQHLNGYHAMGYVRMRHSDDDLMRAERQHKFLEAIRDKVKSPGNFMKLPDVLNAVTDSIDTNLSIPQLLTISNFARLLPKEKITIATLPVVEGPSYCYAKVGPDAQLISKLFFDSDLPVVSINVPGSGVMVGDNYTPRHRRRRRSSVSADTTIPRNEDGQPMLDSDDEGPMMDGQPVPDSGPGSTTPLPQSSDGGSNPSSGADHSGSTDSGKSGTDRSGGGSDTGKTGGDSGKSSGTTGGATPTPDTGSGSGSGSSGSDTTGKTDSGTGSAGK
jgi:LCP family protein required for cell wall assembly